MRWILNRREEWNKPVESTILFVSAVDFSDVIMCVWQGAVYCMWSSYVYEYIGSVDAVRIRVRYYFIIVASDRTMLMCLPLNFFICLWSFFCLCAFTHALVCSFFSVFFANFFSAFFVFGTNKSAFETKTNYAIWSAC